MGEQQQYISPALPHSDALLEAANLPEGTRSSPTSSYYSTVTTFNLQPQCDANLLTPISASASPPLQQIRKLVGQYPPPPGSPQAQEPSPPGSSRMYHHWNHQFDINGQPSSTSSPMGTPGHVAHDFYMGGDRRTPAPPEPYLGMYNVSEPDPHHIPNPEPPYLMDVPSMASQNPMMMRDHHHMAIDPHHRDLSRTLLSSGPLLSDPSAHARHLRRLSTDNLRGRAVADVHRSASGSPRRRGVACPARVKKTRASRRQSNAHRTNPQVDPSEEHKNCHGEEVPPTLKSTCPDEERCIFESRWRHRHQRGQDMWDSIQGDFAQKYNKTHGKEMLQMKFKRGRSKYIQWLSRDEEILREAWIRVERQRYQIILDTFLEMGGSRNMRLNASDIEVKVVNDLKLEEPLYVGDYRDLEIRRRRKVPTKKRQAQDDAPGSVDDLMVVDPRVPHNEDEVINQVHNRRDMRWETDSSAHSEVVELPSWDNRAPMKMEPPPALRLMNGGSGRGVYGAPK
ncbi:hypothetical protein HIM_03108 [Hirsutella minnesotensis 3608]|nr:hypothetical protein HIM_03108 [Hirsutella minnesotensis 3608]